jgi:RNA polymerase sigma-70 factor (ECF subfamily)
MSNAATAGESIGSSDTELVARLRDGDLAAFEPLMRRHNQTLFRAARSILQDDGEAEDAVQEAYLHAYRSLGQFRGDASVATWLTRIAVNESLRRARRTRTRAQVIRLGADPGDSFEIESAPDPGNDAQPEQSAMRADARRLLEARIDELPDAFRTVFVLRSLEEMSIQQIAECLAIPEPTVRTRYFRAKGLLRESLSRDIDVALEDAFRFAGERCDRIVRGSLARCTTGIADVGGRSLPS